MMIERLGGLDPLKNVQNTQKTHSRVETSFHADSISVSAERITRKVREPYRLFYKGVYYLALKLLKNLFMV